MKKIEKLIKEIKIRMTDFDLYLIIFFKEEHGIDDVVYKTGKSKPYIEKTINFLYKSCILRLKVDGTKKKYMLSEFGKEFIKGE